MSEIFRRALILLALVVVIPACGRTAGTGGGSGKVVIASGTIGPAGGSVGVTDPLSPDKGTKVDVPPGAVTGPTDIKIEKYVSGSPYAADVMAYEMSPSGLVFTAPVTVTVPYAAALLTNHRITDPTSIKIVETTQAPLTKETLVTSAQDIPNKLVSGTTTHFCTFAALAFSEASLSGNYHFQALSYDYLPTQAVNPGAPNPLPPIRGFFCDYGKWNFDGAGNMTGGAGNEKYDQTLSPWAGPLTGTYVVSEDGALTFGGIGAGSEADVVSGGDIILLRKTLDVDIIQVGMYIREGSGMSVADLNGIYHFQSIGYDHLTSSMPNAPTTGTPLPPPQGFFSTFGSITFDGAGNFTMAGNEKDDQAAPVALPGTGTYTVAADGTLTLVGLTSTITGAALSGGEIGFFRAAGASDSVEIGVAVKQGAALTNAALSGNYAFQIWTFDHLGAQANAPGVGIMLPPARGFFCDYGTMTFDGAGNVTFNASLEKYDQVTMPNSPISGTYSVAANGTITFAGFQLTGVTGGVLNSGQGLIFRTISVGGDVSYGMAIHQ